MSEYVILPFNMKEGTCEKGLSKFLKNRKIIFRGEPFYIEEVNKEVKFYKDGDELEGVFFQLKSPLSTKQTLFDEGVCLTIEGIAGKLK